MRNPFNFDFSQDIPSHTRSALTPSQQETFFVFLDSDKCSARHKDVIIVLIETGLRIIEFCGLTVDDIDFSANTLCVKRQLIYRPFDGATGHTSKRPRLRQGIGRSH